MVGVEFCDKAGKIKPQLVLHLVQEMLKEGFLALPEGGSGEVLAWTPPLCISRADLISSVVAVEQILDRLMSKPVPDRDQKTQRSSAKSP